MTIFFSVTPAAIFVTDEDGDGLRGGDDSLQGGDGNDTLAGDAGGNFIASGQFGLGQGGLVVGGADDLDGGAGNDSLYGDAVGDFAVTGDEATARGGNDLLEGGDGNDVIYGDAGGSITVSVAVTFAGPTEAGDDELHGGDGMDLLVGDAEDLGDYVVAGDDMLYGGDGDDTLYGDSRDDTDVVGGADVLDGGGDDDLYGGAGDDHFVLSEGNDVIHDFTAGGTEDALVIGDVFSDGADALANAMPSGIGGSDTVFTYMGGTTTLMGVALNELSQENDFVFALA